MTGQVSPGTTPEAGRTKGRTASALEVTVCSGVDCEGVAWAPGHGGHLKLGPLRQSPATAQQPCHTLEKKKETKRQPPTSEEAE